MEIITHLECSKCGEKNGQEVMYHCPKCGTKGTLDVNYDMDMVKKNLTYEYLKSNKDTTIWRYLPILPIETDRGIAPLKIGNSPLYKSHRLEAFLNLKSVYLKDETRNPTSSFKDRASAVGIAKAIELDKTVLCAASTGNAASSLSGFAACLGIKNYIFVPKSIPDGKLSQLLIFGSKVILVDGDYDTAFDFCMKAV